MLLHQHFIDNAKQFGKKLAINDFTTNRELTYHRSLIACLILSRFFGKLDKGFIGIMLPTSAGCILTKTAVLMSGRTPVMINYSTGAEHNARYAQQKCDFKTIITSKAMLEKIECPFVDGMIYIEDIMAGHHSPARSSWPRRPPPCPPPSSKSWCIRAMRTTTPPSSSPAAAKRTPRRFS